MSWWCTVAAFIGGCWVGFFYAALFRAAERQDRERENALLRARISELERTVEYYRAVAEDAREQFNALAEKGAKRGTGSAI